MFRTDRALSVSTHIREQAQRMPLHYPAMFNSTQYTHSVQISSCSSAHAPRANTTQRDVGSIHPVAGYLIVNKYLPS